MNKIILIAIMVSLAMADVGKVVVVKGDASVERDVKILKVHNNMGLLKQDVVETTEGRLQMHFKDNTVISLGKDTRFVIKEYLYVENSQEVAATFSIEKGFIKTITGAIGKIMPELFVLETSNTKITPHGTIWSVEVNDESETYKVLEGRVTLTFNDGLDRKIELLAGETASLQKGTDGTVKKFNRNKIKQNHVTTKYENSVEKGGAVVSEDVSINSGRIVDSSSEIVSDDNNDQGDQGEGDQGDQGEGDQGDQGEGDQGDQGEGDQGENEQ